MSVRVETLRALLALVAVLGSIAISFKYESYAPVTASVLSGVVGGYFGLSDHQRKNDQGDQ